uniref:alpha-1,3-mannosyl-glycoprotein 2-beta-N-acetylglucosaminyltransferase n=1 Tax=Bicosoecida sp. CB-2014 TaxID=1486930 RepID=A0A7S1G4T3_9STRA
MVDDGSLPAGYIPILMPAYDRPEYLAQVLKALERADGMQSTVLIVSQDGDNARVAAMLDAVTAFRVVRLSHWRPYLGGLPRLFLSHSDFATADNVRWLLRFAFESLRARNAIVLESDIRPSTDFYRFFQWMAAEIEGNATLRERVWTVNGYNMRSRRGADPYTLSPFGFTVWGWLCPGSTWPDIRDGWTWFHNWDIQVEAARRASGRASLTPALSRMRNIGMQGINFDVRSAADAAKWEAVWTSEVGVPYWGKAPVVTEQWARA